MKAHRALQGGRQSVSPEPFIYRALRSFFHRRNAAKVIKPMPVTV